MEMHANSQASTTSPGPTVTFFILQHPATWSSGREACSLVTLQPEPPFFLSSPETSPTDPLFEAIARPVAALQARYRTAGRAVTTIIDDLGKLAATARAQDPLAPLAPSATEPLEQRPPLARLEVDFDDADALIEFVQEVAALPSVLSAVTVGKNGNQVTVLVDLRSSRGETGDGGQPLADDASNPTVICSVCGRILAAGGGDVSHGVCPECTREFLRFKT